ncbi:MAG: hypothetical protein ACXABZ_11940 [Candidatus Thorarchaeota archaeon]
MRRRKEAQLGWALIGKTTRFLLERINLLTGIKNSDGEGDLFWKASA